MRSFVLIAAALAWSGAALAQDASPPSQKPAQDPATAVLGDFYSDAPQVGGTVVPAPGGSLLPPMLLPRAPGVAENAGPAPQAPAPAVPLPSDKPSGQAFKPVEYGKLVVRLDVGDPFFVVQSGLACTTVKTLTYPGGVSEYKLPGAKEAFHDELVRAGLAVAGDPNDLFDASTVSADYVISGIATQFRQEVCSPNPVGDAATVQKGQMHLAVEWQLYSRLEKRVLATVNTSADYRIDDAVSGGGNVLAIRVFELNLRQLAASPEIRRVLAGRPLAVDELVKPDAQPPIYLAGELTAQPHGVQAAAGSVVLVRRGAGEGSGFLVSRDGYILTAAHVVGDETEVKVRWPDHQETDGHVVRVSRGRDVALIKTDPRGREPLPLAAGPPQPGQTVYAIGALLGEQNQGTVTRGIVSATRTMHGYSYIQSDVNVGPGDSGGPLLDEQGRVAGLTVSSIRIQEASQGINYFVPIADALSFLSLEPR
jgi:S1-C subfamily serine protease